LRAVVSDDMDEFARSSRVPLEPLSPALPEGDLIHDLMRLYPFARIGPRSHALVMDHLGRRLINHLQTRLADLEGKIDIFIICRTITLVEAPERKKERARQHDASARAVVRLAPEVVPQMTGIAGFAVVPAARVPPDHPAGLLQSAVGIDQLRSHVARVRYRRERLQQGLQPTRGYRRVVVQEQNIFASRFLDSAVAGQDEAKILGVAQELESARPVQCRACEKARTIVNNDYFMRDRIGVFGDRFQAGDGLAAMVIHRDDDRDAGGSVEPG